MDASFAGSLDRSQILRLELKVLKGEHRDLDDAIAALQEKAGYDQLTIQRLKKRKLRLKDKIVHLEDQITPDIFA